MLLRSLDFRFAARRLRRSPSFALATALLIAISIAGTTFVFSVVRTLLFQSVPYDHPERLVVLPIAAAQWDMFEELRDRRDVFDSIGAYTERAANLSGHGSAERVLIGTVTRSFLPLTGVRPSVGRLFLDGDYIGGGDRVALITDRLWRQRYAAASDVVGRTLTLDGRLHTIVGVLPSDFKTVGQLERAHDLPFDREVKALVPLSISPRSYDPSSTDRVSRDVTVMGRLQSGVSAEQANEQLVMILRRGQMRDRAGTPFRFASLAAAVAGGLPNQLAMLSAAVAILFLAGCANVTNLVLARVEVRRREIAICSAMGASARCVIGSILAETVLVSIVGGAVGVVIAWQAIAATKVLAGGVLDLDALTVDASLLAFAAVLSVATGLVVGFGPAMRYARISPVSVLQTSTGAPRAWSRLPLLSLLVVAQVALAVVLVVAGALLVRGFVQSLKTRPAFATERILTAELSLNRATYWRHAATTYFTELLDRVVTLPGVERAALVSVVPGGQFDSGTMVKVDGQAHGTDSVQVSAGYFQLLSIPLLAGRALSDRDTRTSPYVVVVNESFARKHWGTPDAAIGRRVAMGQLSTTTPTGTYIRDLEHTIVGVVADSRDAALGAAPRPKLFRSFRQASPPSSQMTLLVRTSLSDPAALVQPLTGLVRELDSDQPVYNVLPLAEIVRTRYVRERAMMTTMNVFAVLTLLVAALGVYAAMSYAGALRRHEVGVRLALGATRSSVLRLLAWRGMKLVGVGIELGLLLAVISVSLLRARLSDTSSIDPWTVAAAVMLVIVVSAIALLAPAWRATRVDPIATLRAE